MIAYHLVLLQINYFYYAFKKNYLLIKYCNLTSIIIINDYKYFNLKKIEEYKKHCIIALDFFFKDDYEHTLVDLRKSGEAFLKICILEKFGDVDGEKIILGQIDTLLNPVSNSKFLEYQDYLNIVRDEKILNLSDFNRLIDLQKKTNTSAHNPNSIIDI